MHNTLCHIFSSVCPKVFELVSFMQEEIICWFLCSLLIDPHYKDGNFHKLMSRWGWCTTIAIVATLKSLYIFWWKIVLVLLLNSVLTLSIDVWLAFRSVGMLTIPCSSTLSLFIKRIPMLEISSQERWANSSVLCAIAYHPICICCCV
jgi:hypothetical protein